MVVPLVSDFGTFRSTYTDLPPYMEDPNNPGQPDPNVVKTVEVRLTVTDGEATVSESKSIGVAQPPPLLLDQMEYNFDLCIEMVAGNTDQEDPIVHNFGAGGLSKKMKFLTKILNNDMLTSFVYEPFLPNTAPMVSAGLVSHDGREVVISIAAGDLDWDPMTYR